MAFASANANANLNAWVWTKDTIVRRTAAPCVNVGLFPSRLIAKIMLRFLVAVLPKIGITGGIVANAGKWNGRSVGSTIAGVWTVCWNMGRKRIGLLCESFSSSTILRPYFPDRSEF